MRISFACEKCATVLEADARATGQTVTCPHCQTALTVPAVKPGPGVTIGGFRIKKLLARGGMGEVYLAEQLSLGRDVALKILPPHFKSDPETVQRFLSEVRTAAKLQHPNLVTVYEAGEDSGIYFLAMAYIDGETLDTILERQGRLPESQALQITYDLASALASAWQSHRLIHCDVKPGNIMVDRTGKPHLMDMGLSKLLAESTAPAAKSADAFGTPNYVSPEQSFNEPNLDFRSDMFSLGMTLYHMLTGRLPFEAPTPAETLHKLDTETLLDPRAIVPGISPGCVVLLERMLARKPANRYPSWELFLKECQRVRKGGKPTLPLLRPGESVLARSRGPATAALPARRGLQPGTPQPPPHHRLLWELLGLAAIVALAGAVGYVNRAKLKELFAKPRPQPASPVVIVQTNVEPATAVSTTAPSSRALTEHERELQNRFLAAQRYAKDNPEDFAEITKRYRAIVKDGAGTVWADKASIELKQLVAARKRAYDEVRKQLESQVEDLLAQGKLEQAIAYLRSYQGPLQQETEAARLAQAAKLQARLDKQRAESQKIQPFLTGVADELLRGEFPALKQRLAAAESDPDLAASAECRSIREMALKVAAMPEAVLASLKRDIGKRTTLRTVRGPQEGELVGVEGDLIRLKKTVVLDGQVTGFVEEKYRLSELTADEWLRRLTENTPEQQLMRGVLTYHTRQIEKARELFQQCNHPLAALLTKRLEELHAAIAQREKALVESAAMEAYNALLQLAHPDFPKQPPESLPGLILRTRIGDIARGKLQAALKDYWTQYGNTDWAKSHMDVLVALADIGSKAPRAVRVDEEAFDRALEKLRADNPDGPLNCRASIEPDGIVLSLRDSQGLTSLAALAGLPIKQLNLGGCVRLADISPLATMPLQQLNLDQTLVEDLSPLQGLPLKHLSLNRCKNLRSLRPLKDCPLEFLSLLECPDNLDLSPVQSLPGIRIEK